MSQVWSPSPPSREEDNAPTKRARVAASNEAPTEAADSTTSTGSTRAAFASTAAAVTGKVGQTKADLTGRASQFTARTRQDPRSAAPVVATVSAGVVVVWLARRVIRRPEPVLEGG